MAKSEVQHFKNVNIVASGIKGRIDVGKLNKNLDRAQFALDSQIMTDMVPFMPHNSGTFVNLTRAQSAALAGSGVVVAAAPPMGRFLYEGKVMVDPATNSPFARPGAKKIVTERPLTYSNPQARPHWFEVAKEKNFDNWLKIVERELNK